MSQEILLLVPRGVADDLAQLPSAAGIRVDVAGEGGVWILHYVLCAIMKFIGNRIHVKLYPVALLIEF